jgi:hypothetical protein
MDPGATVENVSVPPQQAEEPNAVELDDWLVKRLHPGIEIVRRPGRQSSYRQRAGGRVPANRHFHFPGA